MKTPLFRFTLYAIIVYLTGGTFNPAIAASQPSGENGTPLCGVIDYPPDKQHSDQYPNRRYARTFAANLNASEPPMVRLIYFLPSDRQPQPDIDTKMDTLIKEVQQFYANQMENHGFGRKTFAFEADVTGKAVVHHVNGKFNDAYYQHNLLFRVIGEIGEHFDTSKDIYLVVLDSSQKQYCGVAHGRFAFLRVGDCDRFWVAAHELEHTFGLNHDFRAREHIMYIFEWTGFFVFPKLSKCSAEWLDAHPFFNTGGTSVNDNTTIEMLPPSLASPPNVIRLRFEVTDPDGLHQALLLRSFRSGEFEDISLLDCKRLNGDRNSIVEFVTAVLRPKNKWASLNVIDVHGNFTRKAFPIDITPLLSPSEIVSMPDANLAAAVRETLSLSPGVALTSHTMLELWGLTKTSNRPAKGSNRPITDLTGLEHARALEWLYLSYNSISDVSSLAGLTQLKVLTLENNSLSDASALAGLTQLNWLDLENNSITDISTLAGLTQLTRLHLYNNSISDVSPLAGLTQLTTLVLRHNAISDVSALAGLTQLTYLHLWGNAISDVSSLAGLTQLNTLHLYNNSISDVSPLAGLTQLTTLVLRHNAISDVSPLLGLNLTGTQWDSTGLYLERNPLSYASIHTHIPALQAKGIEVKFENRTHPALLKISGDNQQGASFAPLSNPFVVEAQDENGSVLAGISVVFAITGGGGTLSVTRTTTDNNGRAQSTLTLGPNLETNTVSVSATGIQGAATFRAIADTFPTEYLLSIPAGISLIHLPLKVTAVDGAEKTITSIADLYDALGGAATVNLLGTHDSKTRRWFSYTGPPDKGTSGDQRLTDDKGIIAVMKAPVAVRLRGDALGTPLAGGAREASITLHRGINLVGVPLRDSRIARVSDLFALDGIRDNVVAITVSDNRRFSGGRFKTVRQVGDEGDIPITGGQSFNLKAQTAATVAISGDGWYNRSGEAAGPPVAIPGIEVEDVTPILAVRGSIVSPVGGWGRMPYLRPGSGFRVIVKNLSIGRSVSTERRSAFPTVTGDEKEGYRLTMVDVETGRAAMIGDILEVSVQSPSPLIGVQPLRYTVTAEDVLRSRVELADLVAYEIPTETELLRNYPNPFNPETWIPYRLAEDAFVMLTIYDGSGRVVRTLEVGHRIAAVYESRSKAVYWDGRNGLGEWVASGLYFYTLSAEDYSATRKMLVVK